MKYTIIIQKDEKTGWYSGQCLQIPQAITQGENLDELKANMKEAIALELETRKEEVLAQYSGKKFFRRNIEITA